MPAVLQIMETGRDFPAIEDDVTEAQNPPSSVPPHTKVIDIKVSNAMNQLDFKCDHEAIEFQKDSKDVLNKLKSKFEKHRKGDFRHFPTKPVAVATLNVNYQSPIVFEEEKPVTQVTRKWRLGTLYELIPGRLWFTAHYDDAYTIAMIKANPAFYYFSSSMPKQYQPFCADFGPVNLGIVFRFCQIMRSKLNDSRLNNRKMVFYTHKERDICTNSAFLLGSYLMIDHGYTPEQAMNAFANFSPHPFLNFRDATYCPADYDISIYDCFCGLHRAIGYHWFDGNHFNLAEYDHWDHPKQGDLHQINHKFIAFRGPVSRRGACKRDTGCEHHPREFLSVFADKGVTAVIRLNDVHYKPEEFTNEGFRHYDLYFDDCTVPSIDIIERFLDICDKEGMLAVHCYAGLGRTGTLIALWLMKHYSFSANEAIAWIRIVRPGSVIGPQQHFLREAEDMLWQGNRLVTSKSSSPSKHSSCGRQSPATSLLVKQVTEAVQKRGGSGMRQQFLH